MAPPIKATPENWIAYLTDHAIALEPGHYHWKLTQFPEAWQVEAIRFLERGGPWSLFLEGHVGSRKTSFAMAILRLWRSLWLAPTAAPRPGEGCFLPMYEAAAGLRNLDECARYAETWAKTSLLVMDDLGAGRDTPHLTEQLCYIIENRYDHCAKTIITSNLDLDGIAKHLDARISNRLQEGILLDLGEKDWRREPKR